MTADRDAMAEITQDWLSHFPGLMKMSPELQDELRAASRVQVLPEGTRLFGPGQAPTALALLLKGSVRVQQTGESGREITLYRVQAGESCVLTTACLLAYEDYAAEGIAETEVTAAIVPRDAFEHMIERSPEFRRFIFSAYSRRISDLFTVIEEVAFRRVDVRLAGLLLKQQKGGVITATHQALAAELGTAREVVSRTLQDFSRRGWVELGRGSVQLTAPAALERLSRT
ncbi:Crp/Fnr family transcriptional regulator [Paracoccus sp. MBLB3053]|uniref:Crp/Fnr family transcriptional regulator n=1 Tax=Paracoccus aurantius TaxID=3073814 RepID=A0ABU2HVT8_9RHOB|nr:Crp/Fnr family transcriptional regulator [Paracoccus sp. MBLB3053]MDS9469163.1 Crp/Fnr family transcriptional regulator [Paracoccus sp. MBLB3053]